MRINQWKKDKKRMCINGIGELQGTARTFEYLCTEISLLEEMLNIKVDVVLDPVFLVDETRWANFGRSVDVKKKYLFLYFLQENEKLLKYAKPKGYVYSLTHQEIAQWLKDNQDALLRYSTFNIGVMTDGQRYK